MTAPVSISSPSLTRISAIVPSLSAVTGISIFIDCRVTTGSPDAITSPALTCTVATKPGSGLSTSADIMRTPPLTRSPCYELDRCRSRAGRRDLDSSRFQAFPHPPRDFARVRRVTMDTDRLHRQRQRVPVDRPDLVPGRQAHCSPRNLLGIPGALVALDDEAAAVVVVEVDVAFADVPNPRLLRQRRFDLAHPIEHDAVTERL